MDALATVVFIFSYVFSLLRISTAVDTINVNQHIRDGETITSAGGTFQLGFFSPGDSKNRFLGIWYKKVVPQTVVWVANRESPLTDSSGVLKVTQQGILVLVSGTNGILWNSNSSRSAQDPNAQLLESGNLVMRNGYDSDPENFLWQSFDYPCDTLLPGMKFGRNRVTGLDRYLSSWTSADDPSKVYGICKIDESPKCECMKGFRPKFQSNWDMADWSKGCVRSTPLDCQKGDGFVKYSGVKLPDTRNSWFDESMNLKECASLCLRNCSCTAYANSDIRGGGSGCLLWFDDLIDIRDFTQNGQEFYARMAASESEASSSINSSSKKKKKQVIVIFISITGIVFLSPVLILYVLKKRKKQLKKKEYMDHKSKEGENNEGQEHLDLPLFDLDTLLNATNNFSRDNKLGEGGFRPVYKGILQEGQEIAVKMMSKTSRQGLKEFKNEVESITKLQHRNLVKLLDVAFMAEKDVDL
ncbi:G-type lectin S-receptor-like serine/threonine-protein kinase [Vitis vinifera]|uniref:G-type lectin S-receptor-like serine/threonine-protein kinase n=1 Tax=Vitis vinifera TaxID=29760 RepID=A0A438BPQ7_VITVI|nr:G-type lectin S-receptor-like serine/threonine-protein kinase [Vitis vinifera]